MGVCCDSCFDHITTISGDYDDDEEPPRKRCCCCCIKSVFVFIILTCLTLFGYYCYHNKEVLKDMYNKKTI